MNTQWQKTQAAGRMRSRRIWAARLMGWVIFALSAPSWAIDLQDVQFSALPGQQIQIQLNLSEQAPQPQTFATESPARIAIDLPGVSNRLANRSVPIGLGVVHSLVAVESGGRTRVVLNLIDPAPYEVMSTGKQVLVKVGGQRAQAAPSPAQMTQAQAAPSQVAERLQPAWAQPSRVRQVQAAGPEVRDINFRRGPSGEGRVMIKLPSRETRVAVREQASRIYVDLYQTSLPQQLYRRLDVVDFGTPVTLIESRPKGQNVEVEVQMEGDYDYMAYQTDDLFTLDIRPLTPVEKEELARKKVVYQGERLSLNFQDIPVRSVLQILADFTDLNLVASDTVQGNITLRLKNVPWDQALDIILKTKGLAMRQDGNVIRVAPAQELAAQEQLEMESMQKIEELAPLRTEFIQVNYAKASEIAAVLMGAGRGGGGGGTSARTATAQAAAAAGIPDRGILSPRGSVTVDERTNTLIVQDTLAALEAVRRAVRLLDIPVRQVMIESRVVIANNNFARDLGVKFGVSGSAGRLGSHEILIGGGQSGGIALSDYDAGPFGLNTGGTRYNSILIAGSGGSSGSGSETGGSGGSSGSGGESGGSGGSSGTTGSTGSSATTLITNLPAISPSGSIDFLIGKVGSYLVQLELSAMQREGRGEIISSPRVVTADKSPATIKVGTQIPYQEKTGEGNTSVAFKEAVLQLDVIPQITPEERIIMDLEIKKDNPDWSRSVEGTPPIETRSIKTNVLVDNGETVVLGGVFEREKSFGKEQVPWLGDMPVLGRLFKKEARNDDNKELLIFVTPKILKSDLVETR